ncbi:hypothetical protein DVH24_026667 [Malus domestica]|uniref:Uncharacterized protein n=1 Tax=Malus domestica TaxID=3750 RepID=A0A498K4A7_MALDO|nr:hypothetical protein DVH24_026667 [Malus domestica]
MDKKISDIPGMEGLFRHRDLPSFYRLPIDHPSTKFFMEETKAITRASALIINTFDGLEASIIPTYPHFSPKFTQ